MAQNVIQNKDVRIHNWNVQVSRNFLPEPSVTQRKLIARIKELNCM